MTITAKYPGRCSKCGRAIRPGEQIEIVAITRRNVNIPDDQWEWLRKRAYETGSSVSEALRGTISGAMAQEEGNRRMRIVIVEAGADYTERRDVLETTLTGTETEMVAQAICEVAARGYRVMDNGVGGCCEHMGDYIAVTVYPADEAGSVDPNSLIGQTLDEALDTLIGTVTL